MVDLFGKYGAIVSIKFRVNPHVQVATYKQGFVLYDNVESAKLAIKNLDQSNIFSNKPLGVEFWVSK
jgi:RNA recognition motif-containing protein